MLCAIGLRSETIRSLRHELFPSRVSFASTPRANPTLVVSGEQILYTGRGTIAARNVCPAIAQTNSSSRPTCGVGPLLTPARLQLGSINCALSPDTVDPRGLKATAINDWDITTE